MNNQKVTRLSTKNHEIATLKKGNNYLLERVKQQAGDLHYYQKELRKANDSGEFLTKCLEERDSRIEKLVADLTEIKSHWLYKLFNWFK